jgi:hypothetical protein
MPSRDNENTEPPTNGIDEIQAQVQKIGEDSDEFMRRLQQLRERLDRTLSQSRNRETR